MNILLINKFYHIISGTNRYFFELSRTLLTKKQDVAFFSMEDKKNYSTRWDKYFVSNISFEQVIYSKGFAILGRMLFSIEARKKLLGLLTVFNPAIVHLHTIHHHISPSILPLLKNGHIPVIQTLGEYHLISPNYNMFHDGKICEITKPNKFYKAIFHKCVKNSYLASLAEVVEKYFHFLLGWERNYIDYFIAPSLFMKSKLLEYGFSEEKIVYLPYFIDYRKYKTNYNLGNYLLYFGRLSPEKGLSFLLDVMVRLPDIKLKIVGRGQEEESLKLKVKSEKLGNVEFLGFMDEQKLKKLITESRFTVLPSLWYDVAPISILESFASGKPMVASNIGGIPETVKDGYNGFLFEPGNVDDCVEKVNKLWSDPVLYRKIARNAREYIEKNFGPEEHYEKLMEIYKMAIKKYE